MKKTIKGPFEVKSTPLATDEVCVAVGVMRMRFDKQFSGALEANGIVSMMGMMNQELGSGAYVALERITGTLEGRKGSFSMQHSSSMNRSKPTQAIRVVPDSGTGELLGLKGEMTIDILEGGKHFYNFTYEFES
jgi:hypothetical protein